MPEPWSRRPSVPFRLLLVLPLAGFALTAQQTTPAAGEPPPLRGAGHAGHGHEPAAPNPFRLLEVSADLLVAAGTSTERGAALRELQGGAHDPRQRGFTLQQAELSVVGEVDPWFRAEMHLITSLDAEDGATVVELEEAFLTTRQLPGGLEVKAGTYFTEVGRLNPLHPHAWDWQDQPVILTRLFGGDGMRGPGARIAWRPPGEPRFELLGGVHDAHGETMTSFLSTAEVYEERAIGGRSFTAREARTPGDFVYALRCAITFEPAAGHHVGLGASALFGPNASGADGDTVIQGADFVWRWGGGDDDHDHDGPSLVVQGEWLVRAFGAEAQTDAADPQAPVALPGLTLDDEGGYVHCLWGFAPAWALGVRGEWATGNGASYDAVTQTFDRASDPFRCDRLQVSPLLVWRLGDASRLRLQYDYDDSDHLAGPAHSVWLGCEVMLGTRASHSH